MGILSDKTRGNLLTGDAARDLLGLSPLAPSLLGGAASDLFGKSPVSVPMPGAVPLSPALTEAYRRRGEWNERFMHWERRESDSECERIERARDMVKTALESNTWLTGQRVNIMPQGSFTNRTNTRLEADIDLRMQHPVLKVEYGPYVDQEAAWKEGNYIKLGVNLNDLARDMRVQALTQLKPKFGDGAVSLGNKAIRVKGLAGSRAEVDVVPCFTLHHVAASTLLGGNTTFRGVAILGCDNRWTLNFPEQHLANGRWKHESTGRQFKKVVRILKRLRADMEERGLLKNRPASFLIECLVNLVEDRYFTVATDDRYDRVTRVLARLQELLSPAMQHVRHYEISGLKLLFGANQAWTIEEARTFVLAARLHVGGA